MAWADDDGRWGDMVPRLAGFVIAVPATIGFVALGAGVIATRSLLGLVEVAARTVRALDPGGGHRNRGPDGRTSSAA